MMPVGTVSSCVARHGAFSGVQKKPFSGILLRDESDCQRGCTRPDVIPGHGSHPLYPAYRLAFLRFLLHVVAFV